jgi:HSP20 family molecular chaperone IbpA
MLSQALAALAEAERMHRQVFQPPRGEAPGPCWEPPADVLETEREVLVLVALPGVDPERVEAAIENGELVVRGRRVLPPELRQAVIHRLELPQGRFERRIPLPVGRYALQHRAGNGCLVFTLEKLSQAETP